jgi:hypothetical protein
MSFREIFIVFWVQKEVSNSQEKYTKYLLSKFLAF